MYIYLQPCSQRGTHLSKVRKESLFDEKNMGH